MLSRLSRSAIFVAGASTALAGLAPAPPLHAQSGQFDLVGPTIEVKVNRGGRTLPIAEVPTLAEGDRIWLHPVLAEKQAVRYLMVATFLRGSTNPPPEDWFIRAETWDKKIIEEGIYVTVPPGAQQAIVFLAPETGGDLSTLKNAVRGRPGSFVRASQDLNVASLDRARLDTYLEALKHVDEPARVKETSAMLGRSLGLKVDQQCFDRSTDQQAPCLMQNQDQMILDNGRSATVSSALTNGPTSDLALQAGAMPRASYGYYNSYIAAGMDIARILDNFHTAQYQYIPALSSEDNIAMKLRLNTPPSFHNPKSVLVIALPPIEPPQPPPLYPVDPKQTLCMQRDPLVLPVEGSPAFFAAHFAHGLTLHLEGNSKTDAAAGAAEHGSSGTHGSSLDLPVTADAARGGFAVPAKTVAAGELGSQVTATVHGFWGFEPYTGPTFKLESTNDADWAVATTDASALVVGRDDDLHLTSPSAACVDSVMFRDAHGKEAKAAWKLSKPNEITATLPLKNAEPGELTLEIRQAGLTDVRTLTVTSFSEAGKFESFTMHAGDRSGTLTGTRLDEVARLTLKDVTLLPATLTRSGSTDELKLESAPAKGSKAGPSVSSGEHLTAHVVLKDGRKLDVPASITSPRPQVTVLNKSIALAATPTGGVRIQLASADELPLDGKLTFALKSQAPAIFARAESIEVATEDGMASVILSLAPGAQAGAAASSPAGGQNLATQVAAPATGAGGLVLQDAKTAIATLDPVKAFGTSAFGPLQVRPLLPDGSAGDWQKLATLVRLPALATFSCPADPTAPCTLAGSSLFLLDAVAADAQFTRSTTVPDGFAGSTLDVPHASGQEIYIKLRDNPGVVNAVELDAPVHSRAVRAVAPRRPDLPGAQASSNRMPGAETGDHPIASPAAAATPAP